MAEQSEIIADAESQSELAAAGDPFDLFSAWFAEAEGSEPKPSVMEGRVNSRGPV